MAGTSRKGRIRPIDVQKCEEYPELAYCIELSCGAFNVMMLGIANYRPGDTEVKPGARNNSSSVANYFHAATSYQFYRQARAHTTNNSAFT